MFQDACALVFPCLCQVGGVSADGTGASAGMGCLFGPQYVITAKHVADFGRQSCGCAAVMPGTALWICRVAAEWDDLDITVLKMERLVRPAMRGVELPSKFPQIGGNRFGFGLSVGYFGALYRPDRSGKPDRYTYFASASLSFFTRDVHRWALSAGFAEEGFSGSPVFTTNGALVGVLTEILRIAEPTGQMPQLVTVPLMSPIKAEMIREIAKVTGASIREC